MNHPKALYIAHPLPSPRYPTNLGNNNHSIYIVRQYKHSNQSSQRTIDSPKHPNIVNLSPRGIPHPQLYHNPNRQIFTNQNEAIINQQQPSALSNRQQINHKLYQARINTLINQNNNLKAQKAEINAKHLELEQQYRRKEQLIVSDFNQHMNQARINYQNSIKAQRWYFSRQKLQLQQQFEDYLQNQKIEIDPSAYTKEEFEFKINKLEEIVQILTQTLESSEKQVLKLLKEKSLFLEELDKKSS